MARIDLTPEAERTPEERAVCEEAASGLRGRIPAPMVAWLRNPELARRAQRIGQLLRYQTTLEPRLSELAILVAARQWNSHYEWTAHKREGLKAGVDPAVVAAIAARRPPPALRDEAERVVYEVSSVLLATRATCRRSCTVEVSRRWASAGWSNWWAYSATTASSR